MKTSIRTIKSKSKQRLNQDFGDAFIIVFVPFFIAYSITILFSQLTSFLPFQYEILLDALIQILLLILGSYVSYRLIISYVRGKKGVNFDQFFHTDKRLLTFALLNLLIVAIMVLIYTPVLPLLRELDQTVRALADVDAINFYLSTSDILERISDASLLVAGYLVIFWLVSIRFSMAFFLIADKKLSLLEALKMSFKLTKGNYFRILLFPFSYFFWLLLCLTFFGMFYSLPLIFSGYGYLYNSLLNEYKPLG